MRTATSLALCAALASTALLTGCGTGTADAPGGPDAFAPCATETPAGDPSGLSRDHVSVVNRTCGPSGALVAEFEVSNTEKEPLTFTITFSLVNDSGQAMDNITRTVESVKPGQTVRRPLSTDDEPVVAQGRLARILKVRAVPAAEAAAASGACPPSGIRVTNDQGDAAMGLRVVGLHLLNCGSADYSVEGYPALQLLDEDRDPVKGVRILHGTDRISTGIGGDPVPRPLTLRPGESAYANLAWRNTTREGDAVNAPYVRVTAKPGATPVTVTPELDLGTTGRLGIGPWTKDDRRN